MRIRSLLLVQASLLTALAVTVAADVTFRKPPAQPMGAQISVVSANPVVLGSARNAKWTATTVEAATSDAHKKALAGGKVATITGEVVDVSCYLQLGKRGEAHIPCGSKCIANGQPIGIVDAAGTLTLVMPEEHHPRRDGQVELKTVLGPLLAKTVTLSGMLVQNRGYRALYVQAAGIGGAVAPAESGGNK